MDDITNALNECTEKIKSKHYTKKQLESAINAIDRYIDSDDVKKHPMHDVIATWMVLGQNELRKLAQDVCAKEALEAAETLRRFCTGRNCLGCIFAAGYADCILAEDDEPCEWDLDAIRGDAGEV